MAQGRQRRGMPATINFVPKEPCREMGPDSSCSTAKLRVSGSDHRTPKGPLSLCQPRLRTLGAYTQPAPLCRESSSSWTSVHTRQCLQIVRHHLPRAMGMRMWLVVGVQTCTFCVCSLYPGINTCHLNTVSMHVFLCMHMYTLPLLSTMCI